MVDVIITDLHRTSNFYANARFKTKVRASSVGTFVPRKLNEFIYSTEAGVCEIYRLITRQKSVALILEGRIVTEAK